MVKINEWMKIIKRKRKNYKFTFRWSLNVAKNKPTKKRTKQTNKQTKKTNAILENNFVPI